MMFHSCKFIICQASWFFQDLIADRNFSDIMQGSGQIHLLGRFFIKSHKTGKFLGIYCYSDRMCTGKWRFIIDDPGKKLRQFFDLCKIKFLFGARNFAP